MAEWSNATMTDVGADLQAKVNAGKTKLTFTKIKVGSGVNATNPLSLTDVISSKWETTNFVVKQEGKIVSVDTFITNTGIHEAFRMSEIGLFAQDPDKGEILYAYLTDPEPDRMPAEGGSVVVSQELTIGMVFSNTGNVSLTVNMGALVTHEQLERHNSDANAHDNRFNAIIQQVNNMITPTDESDKQSLAPTLALVKTLQKGYLPITGGDLKGEITVNGKAAKTIVDSWYSDDKSQYWIKYSDGELVQMITKDNPNNTGITVTIINLFQPFIDTNYFVNAVYETHSTRRPNSNTSLSNSITAVDNTISDSNFSPKTKTRFTIATDTMSLCRVYCVGRWK